MKLRSDSLWANAKETTSKKTTPKLLDHTNPKRHATKIAKSSRVGAPLLCLYFVAHAGDWVQNQFQVWHSMLRDQWSRISLRF